MSKIVSRTLDFFELFATTGTPLTLSDISRRLELPASSCHDVLQTLLERGYLYQLGNRGGLFPTHKLANLAEVIAAADPLIQRAELQLRQLQSQFGESVFLAKIEGAQARYVLSFESASALRFFVQVGNPLRALHATSAGKAVLGTLEPDLRAQTIAGLDMAPLTGVTLSSRAALAEEVSQSVARGWFLNREESVPTATTVSTTFVWNRVHYILTMAGPTHRMEPKLDQVVAALQGTARALENPFGPASSEMADIRDAG